MASGSGSASQSEAMAAATPDRLSDLPDDLLIHILSFAPSLEAACTTVLSRRWRRPLWFETGVLNLDHRSYTTTTGSVPLLRRVWDDAHLVPKFCRSRGRDPRKLTLVMRDDTTHGHYLTDGEEKEHPGVEELRVELLNCASPAHCKCTFYSSLSLAALGVLEITGYILKPCSDARRRAFPCLEAMQLRRCRMEIATLQDMIYAAPRVADLRLQAVCFEDDQYEYHLRCPTATVIVIAGLHTFSSNLNFRACSVKLDAPRVRRFLYTHVITFEETHFSFDGHTPPYLEQVHLAVHAGSSRAAQVRRSLLASVRHIRFLKLTAYSTADLDDVMQYCFYNLERLEIEDLCRWCIRNDRDAASALVNLLRRCPGVRVLRLKFSWGEYLEETTDPADLSVAMSDFAPCNSLVNTGDGHQEVCCDGLGLHKLCCGCELDCLQDSLRRVVVEFDAEEFVIDGGKRYNSSHIDHKIVRWRKRRRRTSSPLPAMTAHPLWPPPLSEFPPLACAPDPVPASPCSESPASSIAGWRSPCGTASPTCMASLQYPPPVQPSFPTPLPAVTPPSNACIASTVCRTSWTSLQDQGAPVLSQSLC